MVLRQVPVLLVLSVDERAPRTTGRPKESRRGERLQGRTALRLNPERQAVLRAPAARRLRERKKLGLAAIVIPQEEGPSIIKACCGGR